MSAEDNSPVPDYLKRGRVDGRNYVILGGGLGMGRQTVHALSQAGASRIMVVDIEQSRADNVAAEIPGGLGWSGDITNRDEVKRLVSDAAKAFGRVHGIVDIVGMAQWAALLDLSDAMLERDLDINFRHAFLASQEFARHMIDNGGGTMVFIASVSGKTSAPMHAGYGAAKAALMAWVQSLAVELGPHQIRANAIAPGTILTPRMDAAFTPEQRQANEAVSPLGRIGRMEDIASTALFLSTEHSAHITGRTIVVDGGVRAKFPYGTL